MNNDENTIPLPYDRLIEFIEDAKAKDETTLDYELGYITYNNKSQIIKSSGNIFLGRPDKECITLSDNKSNFDLIISPVDVDDKPPGQFFYNDRELCIVKFIDRNSDCIVYRAITCYLILWYKRRSMYKYRCEWN